MGCSFTDLGAEGCRRSLNALLYLASPSMDKFCHQPYLCKTYFQNCLVSVINSVLGIPELSMIRLCCHRRHRSLMTTACGAASDGGFGTVTALDFHSLRTCQVLHYILNQMVCKISLSHFMSYMSFIRHESFQFFNWFPFFFCLLRPFL